MNPQNQHYWEKGFDFDRNHIINDKVAIEVYRILIAYTNVHRNCRVGAYLSHTSFSKFYSLQQIIPNFDTFSEVAEMKTKIFSEESPDWLKEIWGPTFHKQIEKVWRLEWPIWFQYESKSLTKEIFGYKFDEALSVKIEPSDIKALYGDSIRSFVIEIKNYSINVRFSKEISII